MSNHFDYKCRTCNERAYASINRGQSILREVYEAWPTIKPVLDLGCVWVEVNIGALHNQFEVTEFLREHHGHDVCLLSEYGDTEEMTPDSGLPVV